MRQVARMEPLQRAGRAGSKGRVYAHVHCRQAQAHLQVHANTEATAWNRSLSRPHSHAAWHA